MNKTVSIIIASALVVSIGIIFFAQSGKNPDATAVSEKNVEMRDGVQYITINARGGYSPKTSTADSGVPTKLVVKTNGTYDCSLALVIRSIGYQKMLSQTGEEIIDLGVLQPNSTIQGTCSMGMYNFKLSFI